MPAPQKFRSAINGFNREDVVQFIEYTRIKHESEMNRLKEELENARKEVNVQSAVAKLVGDDRLTELEQKCAALEQQCETLTRENESLRMQKSDSVGQMVSPSAEELEAYRRAERAERAARSRVGQMYEQANAVLADARTELDAAATSLNALAEETMERIRALSEAVSESREVLSDAAATLGSIRPEDEEL